MRRLVLTLTRSGHDVTVLDFSKSSLSNGDPTILIELVEEVTSFADAMALKSKQPPLLIGSSLGALWALNVLRRSTHFSSGVLITGGDIVKIAQKLYGPTVWSQTYDALVTIWKEVNMYSKPQTIKGKHILFVLHLSSRLIDVQDVYREVQNQQNAGNSILVVERNSFNYIGTIIEETVLFQNGRSVISVI